MNDMRLFKVAKKVCATHELCRIWMEPADSEPVFEFKAGQFVMVHELDENDVSVGKRSYSIASAPNESKTAIEFGVKSQGPMSGKLYMCKEGDIFGIQGPYGVFVLPEDKGPLALFAGGVGATPIRSMARECLSRDPDASLVVFYSGRTRDDLMYHDEYVELSDKHPGLKYVPVLTRECPEGFMGECGRLNAETIQRHLVDADARTAMICGPQEFMDTVKAALVGLGVDQKMLHTERY